jgi:tetratricopeptide (TPR) repeat protein
LEKETRLRRLNRLVGNGDPDARQFQMERAEFYFHTLKDYDATIEDCYRLLHGGHRSERAQRAFHLLLEAHAVRGTLDRAVDDWRREFGDEASFYEARATFYQQQGEYEKAAEDYGEVIKLRPDDATARRQRVEIYLQLKQWDKAIESLSRASELAPQEVSLWIELLDVRHHVGDAEELQRTAEKAIQSLEISVTDRAKRARALFQLQKKLAGLDLPEHHITALARSVEALKSLAHDGLLDADAKVDYAHKLVTLGGKLTDAGESGDCYSRAEAILEPAIAELKQRSDAQKQLASAHLYLARVRSRQKIWRNAWDLLQESLRLNPREARAHRELAKVCLAADDTNIGDAKVAVRHAVAGLKLKENDQLYRTVCQRAAEALEVWLSEAGQNDPEGHYLLAIALAQLGRGEEAHEFCRRGEALFDQQEQQPDDSLAELWEEARLAIAAGQESTLEE